MYRQRVSIVKIAKEEGVSPDSVSKWLKKGGVELKQGSHFVRQPPLMVPSEIASAVGQGREHVAALLQRDVGELD